MNAGAAAAPATPTITFIAKPALYKNSFTLSRVYKIGFFIHNKQVFIFTVKTDICLLQR